MDDKTTHVSKMGGSEGGKEGRREGGKEGEARTIGTSWLFLLSDFFNPGTTTPPPPPTTPFLPPALPPALHLNHALTTTTFKHTSIPKKTGYETSLPQPHAAFKTTSTATPSNTSASSSSSSSLSPSSFLTVPTALGIREGGREGGGEGGRESSLEDECRRCLCPWCRPPPPPPPPPLVPNASLPPSRPPPIPPALGSVGGPR